MIVDSHVHVWRLDRGDYDWLTPDKPIHRDYTLEDIRAELGPVEAIVLVQAAATAAETRFMLDVAAASDGLVRGVVGWADLEAPDLAAQLPRDPMLKGLRPMLQDVAETEWVLRPAVIAGLRTAHAHGLRLDALAQPRHLPVLRILARALGDMPVVIDHAAKPAIAAGQFEDWAEGMAALAWETQWFCKLSGLVTEAGAGWSIEMLRPYVAHLLACFGPERLIWGSDWPVASMTSSYADWFAAARALVPAEHHAAVFGGTAVRFYGLTPPG